MRECTVHLLPPDDPASMRGKVAVVVDVLRATTTIVTALAQGARNVIPCTDVARALEIARRQDSAHTLLGGERGGKKIDGFDLDNSPCNYRREIVAGKTIVFTTSHGTLAISRASGAARVILAALLNVSAVARQLAETSEAVHIVCSGTDGRPSQEDTLCAALLVGQTWELCGEPTWSDDTTLLLLELYRTRIWEDEAATLRLLSQGRGGRRLTRLGFERDIAYAAQRDIVQIVPQFFPGEQRIRL